MPYTDSVMAPGIREYASHTGIGVALGCRSHGLRVKLVDFLGDDPLDALVRERLAEVDTSFVISPAGTRRAVNLVDPQGRRMSFYDGRDVPGQRLPADLAKVVVITDGERGGHYVTREDPELRAYPPATGHPVIDTNGAGDAFVAAFLHGWLDARPIQDTIGSAALAALKACGTPG